MEYFADKISYICTMQTLIVQPKNRKQMAAVKAALKALGVSFRKADAEPYPAEFTAKLKKSLAEIEAGKITTVEPGNLKEFLGL